MAAATNGTNLFIRQCVHDFSEAFITIDPVFAHFIATGNRVHLVVAIHHFIHTVLHDIVMVAGKQGIPFAAPDHFNNIPASTAATAFKLLNDLAVTPDRAIKSLQIAVGHQNKVVEVFARSDVDAADYLGLI